MYQTWYSDKIISEEREEASNIIKSIPNGLFLIKQDGTISSQYSMVTNTIFGYTNISGQNFLEVMKPLIPYQRKYDSLRIFIDNLYNTNIIENLLIKLNPLHHIKLIINNKPHLLSFDFSRIIKDKAITHILVSIKEIKINPRLDKHLQNEQENSHYQLDLLNILLHTDTSKVNTFMKNIIQHLNKIHQILETIKQDKIEPDNIQMINHEIYAIKSKATNLNLLSFVVLAQSIEELIPTFQSAPKDYLPSFKIRLNALQQEINIIKIINKQLYPHSSITKNTGKAISKSISHLDEFFTCFVQELSKREKKKVKLEIDGLDNISTQSKQFIILKDIITQLIKNAVEYGIESPSNRAEYGKPKEGNLRLKVSTYKHKITLYIEDDGQGIDYGAIREKAIKLQIASIDKLKNWSHKQLLNLVFKPNFSTQDSQDLGQCINLENVRNNIKKLDGRITIETEEQQFTRFIIEIPTKF